MKTNKIWVILAIGGMIGAFFLGMYVKDRECKKIRKEYAELLNVTDELSVTKGEILGIATAQAYAEIHTNMEGLKKGLDYLVEEFVFKYQNDRSAYDSTSMGAIINERFGTFDEFLEELGQ